jgi:protein TonB
MTPHLRPLCAVIALTAALGAAAQSPAQRWRPARMVTIDATCKPAYPPDALRARARGTSVLEFTVDPQGQVSRTAVLRSAGPTPEHRSLDDAAAASLAHCPFQPATDGDGRPVPGSVQVTYDWVIQPAAADTSAAPPAAFH